MDNLDYCNFAKTILMFLVVLCHSVAFYGGEWFTVCNLEQTDGFLGYLALWLGTFHVEAFTLISGYIYYYVKNEKHGYQLFHDFIRNKAKRLLVPYMAVSVMWVIPVSCFFYKYSCMDVFNKFILGESPAQLWFLLMLFNVFMIADVVLVKIRGKKQFMFVLGVFVTGIMLSKYVPNVFQILTATRYLLFFYIGYMIRRKYPKIKPKKMLCIGVFCLIVNVGGAYLLMFDMLPKLGYLSACKFVLKNVCDISGSVMAFLLLSYIASIINWKCPTFDRLSVASFPIYLFHQQVIYVVLWNYSSGINPYVMSGICFFGSLLFSFIVSEMFVRNGCTKFLIGIK